MNRARALVPILATLFFSVLALGAGYPRYGGSLRIAIGLPGAPSDPSLSDTPAEAAVRGLETAPACRTDERGGLEPALGIGWEDGERPALVVGFTSPEIAAAQAAAWQTTPTAIPSPYRSLLFPLRNVAAKGKNVELTTAFRWPDLAASLCHPALALRKPRLVGAGPFAASAPQLGFPGGRPYPDKLEWKMGNERSAQRFFSLNEADLLVGSAPDAPLPSNAPLLFATYLAFRPGAAGPDFRRAVEAAVDRTDLARYFVRAPSAPLQALLPAPLIPADPTLGPLPPPPTLVVPRPLELLLDDSLPDQRAVAERLQVKLHDLGYRVSLKPLPRSALRQRWAKNEFELMLYSVLLPSKPAPALAVVLDVAGRRDLLPLELPALGNLDEAARAQRVKARAAFLAPTLSIVPLYVQGLSMAASPSVRGLTWDGSGLPRLDGIWLAP